MKALLLTTLTCLLLFQQSVIAAQTNEQHNLDLAARAWILIDAHSGQTLAQHNADTQYPVASLNKLMTAEVVLEQIKSGKLNADDSVIFKHQPLPKNATQLYLREAEHADVDSLLQGMVIHSANDAARALAEHVAETENAFVDLMNKRARELGMANSHFADASGLGHKDQGASARDLAMLAWHIAQEHSEFYPAFGKKKFVHNGLDFYNHNTLLWQDTRVNGIKTGHTHAAGYCLATSATKNDMRLITVVLGANKEQDRLTATRQLLDYGFNSFEAQLIYSGNTAITRIPMWMGTQDSMAVGVKNDLYVTLARGRQQDTRAELHVDKAVYAPVAQGQQVGTVSIKLDGEPLKQVPLIALEAVTTGGLFSRMLDSVQLWFN